MDPEAHQTGTSPPLAGVVVADFSLLVPGPLATRSLAQLGATVWKIEPPGGDPSRAYAFFEYLNSGKRSVCLDLKTHRDMETAVALVRKSHVLVEGFRPGVMDRLGLGYPIMRALNPGLVYCSLTGFGRTGPLQALPGHDLTYAAYAGLLDRNRDRHGAQILTPPPGAFADVTAALLATTSISAALVRSQREGRGTHLDPSIFDAALLLGATEYARTVVDGHPDSAVPGSETPHYRCFTTADGRGLALAIAANEDTFWTRFCRATGLFEWESAAGSERTARGDELEKTLEDLFASRPLSYWESTLGSTDIPWAPINQAADVERLSRAFDRAFPGDPCGDVPLGLESFGPISAAPPLGADAEALQVFLSA